MFSLVFIFFFKDPPILEVNETVVELSQKAHNKFSLQIDSRLLNNTNGPITHVGVLVTSDLPGRFLLVSVRKSCTVFMPCYGLLSSFFFFFFCCADRKTSHALGHS